MVGTYKRFNVKGHSTEEVHGPFFAGVLMLKDLASQPTAL